MRAKDVLGRRGEALAAEYLADAGLHIVDRNWRSPAGEIDIVAVDEATLVVVEVKTRSSLDYGHPLEAISETKLARLCLLAGQWARAHDLRPAGYRVDALGIVDDGINPPAIEHLKAVG